MANDNQTALMMSIQRKKDRLEELKNSGNSGNINVSPRIEELEFQISEDENLLAVDREQWIEAFTLGQVSGYNADWENQEMDLPEDKWNEKYGTYGK